MKFIIEKNMPVLIITYLQYILIITYLQYIYQLHMRNTFKNNIYIIKIIINIYHRFPNLYGYIYYHIHADQLLASI